MSALTDPWQAALAAEQQAVFGYGLLGPYLPTTAETQLAMTSQSAHQQLSDATEAALVAAGRKPPPPPPDYPQLYPVTIGASARALAVRLEQDAAVAWRYLYAVAADSTETLAGPLRISAQTALTASAVRGAEWRRLVSPTAATVAFPGI